MSQVNITVGMPEDLMNSLKARAVELGVSRNALVNEGIRRVLTDRWFTVTPEEYVIVRGLAASRGISPATLIREWVDKMIEVEEPE